MAFELIDTFTGTADTALVGHTPEVGLLWLGDSTHEYQGPPVSDVRLTGGKFTYNNAATGGSSLILSPTTFAGSTHQVRASFLFLTDIGVGNFYSIPLYTSIGSVTDCRFGWFNGVWKLTLAGTSQTSAFAFPSSGTITEALITCVDGVSITCEVSADEGQTFATLFGGAVAFTSTAHPFSPGLWYDGSATKTTGVQIGNFRVASPDATPTLAVSPTTATVGTPLTLTLTATGDDWQAGTPGVPLLTVSGGTGASLASQVLTSANGGTVTLNPGSTAGTLTIHDPSGGTATVTVSSGGGSPTSVTLTGPGSGATGVESSAFTATLDAPAGGGGVVVGLASDGSGDAIRGVTGGSTVTSVTVPSGQTTHTFFLVAGTLGARHVSITQGSLTTLGSPITYTATGPALSVGPTTATATDAGAPVAITPSLTGSSAALTASLVGAGSISTAAPASGVAFNYFPPEAGAGTGSATVTVHDATDGLSATCVISYSPAPPGDVAFYCVVDQVPVGLSAPTFTLKNAAGTTVIPSTGGTAVSLGNGVYTIPFTAPDALYVGLIAVGTVTLTDEPKRQVGALPSDGVDRVMIEEGAVPVNLRQAISALLAVIVGDSTGAPAGPMAFTGVGTSQVRVSGNTDPNGNRSGVALNLPT
jgi:hypothetical protein